MNENIIMFEGRPFGGCAIVYNDKIIQVHCNTERLCGIRIQQEDDCALLILNAYMPCDTQRYDDNYNAYIEVMEEVERVISKEQTSHVMLGGDLNTDLSRQSPHTVYLERFIADFNMVMCIR